MSEKPERAIAKGDMAVAHIERSSTNLLTGTHRYSRWFIVECTKADKAGWCIEFRDHQGGEPKRVVSAPITIYGVSPPMQAPCRRVFNDTKSDFIGYETSDDLKAAANARKAG